MKLVEYIAKRIRDDCIDEFDLNHRSENLQLCVNYVFEYFNHYLDEVPQLQKTIEENRKTEKFRNTIRDYSPKVQEWLVNIYLEYGNHMNIQIKNMIDDTFFLLYHSEAEYRSLSYKIYPQIVSKFPFLENDGELIYRCIKDIQYAISHTHYLKVDTTDTIITPSIDKWLKGTDRKYAVNIYAFCFEWCEYWFDNSDLWPKNKKTKNKEYPDFWNYKYKSTGDLFGLDSLFRAMPKTPFTKGKKKMFEAVMMYIWTHDIELDEEYWCEYSSQLL